MAPTAFLILSLLSVTVRGFPADDRAWQSYKAEYGKVYSTPEEDARRYAIWTNNIREVVTHNSAHDAEYEQGINQFSDITEDEFLSTMAGGFPAIPKTDGNFSRGGIPFVSTGVKLPDAVNWVEKGHVTGVKTQGKEGKITFIAKTNITLNHTFLPKTKLSLNSCFLDFYLS